MTNIKRFIHKIFGGEDLILGVIELSAITLELTFLTAILICALIAL